MSSKVFQPVTTRKRNQLEPVNVSLVGKRKKNTKKECQTHHCFFLGGGGAGFPCLILGGCMFSLDSPSPTFLQPTSLAITRGCWWIAFAEAGFGRHLAAAKLPKSLGEGRREGVYNRRPNFWLSGKNLGGGEIHFTKKRFQ